jgi:hypothetical protein
MSNQIQEVELSIEDAKAMIDRGRMVEKLSNNREFKKLVLDGYFTEEAARLTHVYSDPNYAQHKGFIENDIIGIGAFKRYLTTIMQMAQNAQTELESHQSTLEELRQEEMGFSYSEVDSDDGDDA